MALKISTPLLISINKRRKTLKKIMLVGKILKKRKQKTTFD